MKGAALSLSMLAVLAFGASAASASLMPSAAELGHARRVAMAYWHTPNPPCGRESIAYAPLPDPIGAQADTQLCTITFSGTDDWIDYPSDVCRLYVHEYGHLVLGLDYFAVTNPADPMHSPDPTDIMSSGLDSTLLQEQAQERSVGCLAPLKPRVIRLWHAGHARDEHHSGAHEPAAGTG